MKKIVLVNGYISMNNEQLFISINTLKKDIKSKGGWLGVFLAFLAISITHSLRDIDYFSSIFHYFDFGLRILGIITIIGVLYYLLLFKK